MLETDNRISGTGANLERNTINALKAANAIKKIEPPVILSITHYRKRLADPDGLCSKWVIDGIVKAGILPDDNASIIKEIRQKQVKSSKERTIIEIETCEG